MCHALRNKEFHLKTTPCQDSRLTVTIIANRFRTGLLLFQVVFPVGITSKHHFLCFLSVSYTPYIYRFTWFHYAISNIRGVSSPKIMALQLFLLALPSLFTVPSG